MLIYCISFNDLSSTDLLLVAESYITHIRITEDAAYPSGPAPPNAPPENKKPRIIIVSLRKSGRVRMHKARENNDGTFSIGKTWMLDDLSAIQTYSDLPATTPAEQQQKQWASNVGFVVTVGKPYYWQAGNYKERDFFIASLVKIYKKYTGGKVPKLVGFDEKQRQTLIGDSNQGPLRSEASTKPESRPSPPYATQPPSSREGRPPKTEDAMLKAQKSRDQIREPRSTPSPGRPVHARDGPSSKANGNAALEQMADVTDYSESSRATSRTRDHSRPGRAPPSRDGRYGHETKPNPALDVARDPERPNTAGSGGAASLGQSLVQESTERLSRPSSRGDVGGVPPSRDGNLSNRSSRVLDVDLPPALRPGSRPGSSSSLSKAHLDPTKHEPNATEVLAAASKSSESLTLPIQSSDVAPATKAVDQPPTSPPTAKLPDIPTSAPGKETKDSPDGHRPGLGPMFKKKSGKEIANVLSKAATAYTAFRPRPGGGKERLMASQKPATDGPDGITGVVPAPLLRGQSSESAKVSTPTTDTAQSATTESTAEAVPAPEAPPPLTVATDTTPGEVVPPKVEITRAATDEMAISPVDQAKQLPAADIVVPVEDKPRSRPTSPAAQDQRRRRREDNIVKYCQALGIEPTALEGIGGNFDEILTDLGWNGRLSDDKKIDDLEADIRREIGRVQAISWLGNIEQQEGKIDQLAKLIDKTVDECEELDGLLTLYSHELDVRRQPYISIFFFILTYVTDSPRRRVIYRDAVTRSSGPNCQPKASAERAAKPSQHAIHILS